MTTSGGIKKKKVACRQSGRLSLVARCGRRRVRNIADMAGRVGGFFGAAESREREKVNLTLVLLGEQRHAHRRGSLSSRSLIHNYPNKIRLLLRVARPCARKLYLEWGGRACKWCRSPRSVVSDDVRLDAITRNYGQVPSLANALW